MQFTTRLSIFDDDETKLVELGRRYVELREKLKVEAKTDPARTPTPTLIAKELDLTLEETMELIDFAENYLGEYEAELIASKVDHFTDHMGNLLYSETW
jgi:hypothetical protein